ncbi:hypothetical protein DRO38_04455 [Candidatus Bathyarchaeota archaeon]|nr:MAG: hypothetical protein DRO38_04455 [Candidatus Bathyarchaeota archaeon]
MKTFKFKKLYNNNQMGRKIRSLFIWFNIGLIIFVLPGCGGHLLRYDLVTKSVPIEYKYKLEYRYEYEKRRKWQREIEIKRYQSTDEMPQDYSQYDDYYSTHREVTQLIIDFYNSLKSRNLESCLQHFSNDFLLDPSKVKTAKKLFEKIQPSGGKDIRFFYENETSPLPYNTPRIIVNNNIIYYSYLTPTKLSIFKQKLYFSTKEIPFSIAIIDCGTKEVEIYYDVIRCKKTKSNIWKINSIKFKDQLRQCLVRIISKDKHSYFTNYLKYWQNNNFKPHNGYPCFHTKKEKLKMSSKEKDKKNRLVENGEHFVHIGFYEHALRNLIRASELDPFDADLHQEISQVCVFQRKYERAIVALWKALSLNPTSSDLHYSLATVYTKKRWYNLAQHEIQKALEFDLDNYKAKLLNAIIFWCLSCNDIAINLLRSLINKYPEKALGYYTLAKVYASIEDNESAVSFARKALEICPDNTEYQQFNKSLQSKQ